MSDWNKKTISRSEVEELTKKYGVDPLTASIMIRRGITEGHDIMYFMESDLRYQHYPFSFSSMEDAVDRILDAKEEGEKVLIFGDRDVDGVTATTVLYDCLSDMGIDVRYRLPQGDDAYGLNKTAVDDFTADYGSLIITVDCGISNNEEIAYAAEKGCDIIIVDHHNPPETLPEPAIIVDPKLEDSGYPFKDISGCAVVYKLVSALRFSKSEWYKQDITLLNVRPLNDAYTIECLKVRNLVPVDRLDETIVPGTISITQTRLPQFLQGQNIFVWDKQTTTRLLEQTFGKNAVEFNVFDIRPEVAKLIPKTGSLSLLALKDMSHFARYGNHPATEIGGFYNIFVTYIQQMLKAAFPQTVLAEEHDMQLVALAALADIMPMKDENRIFVRQGLQSLNKGADSVRCGLRELLSPLKLLGKELTSTDLSWTVVSHLNAAGRMGHAELAAELFLCKDAVKREQIAAQIIALNDERKKLSAAAWDYAQLQAKASVSKYNEKLCVVIDERINRGVSGILAGRLVSSYNVPSIAVTFIGDTAIGSMRSCRNLDATKFLNMMGDMFLNHGGHTCAAGFSFERKRLDEFEKKLLELSQLIELADSTADIYNVDAEIPAAYLDQSLMKVADFFEPSGEDNPPLLFMAKNLPVTNAAALGKGEKMHLKLELQAQKCKWPALFWNKGELLNNGIAIGDRADVLFRVENNVFNGMKTVQMVLTDIRKC
ncbi:MAG: single-stranded-DNA-specific exonuclease RecJ [Treponema sp.]|nr:single-stranded-DNA-specific exonuclease RecJ [Treponema sp.]